MVAAAMSMDGFLNFSGVQIADGGYIGGEVKKLMQNIKHS